ncbi:MAG TPA: hotdog domain-containing protein [Chthoniobacteraceae bacterium]|nr:hotdog domain-containing protein [Chthoniobacteraceae bacterium]
MTSYHLVTPSELNHHQTWFGGSAMAAADKAAYIAASLRFKNASFVTKFFDSFDFVSPAKSGDIVKIDAEIVRIGQTSVTVRVVADNQITGEKLFESTAVLVNLRDGKKAALEG